MNHTTKIFISYAQDKSSGQALGRLAQKQIEELGYRVFRDETGILPGVRWANEIEEQLKSCDLMILIMSEKIRKSDWVHAEFQYATELDIPVIPIKAEVMLTPLWLRSLQILDFSAQKDWGQLMNAINDRLPDSLENVSNKKAVKTHVPVFGLPAEINDLISANMVKLSEYSNDGKLQFIANNNQVFLIHRAKNAVLHILNGRDGDITACSFSADNKRLASASNDGFVRLWDTRSGVCTETFYAPEPDEFDKKINHCVFSPDGSLLLTTGNFSTHKIWKIETGVCIERFHGFHLWSYAVSFSSDGKLISTLNKLGKTEIWDIERRGWIKDLAKVGD